MLFLIILVVLLLFVEELQVDLLLLLRSLLQIFDRAVRNVLVDLLAFLRGHLFCSAFAIIPRAFERF